MSYEANNVRNPFYLAVLYEIVVIFLYLSGIINYISMTVKVRAIK